MDSAGKRLWFEELGRVVHRLEEDAGAYQMRETLGGGVAGLSLALLIALRGEVEGQGAAVQVPQTGTVAGIVVARESGQAVADATVTIEGTVRVSVTNALGRFRVDDVPAGEVILVVRAAGFLELRVPDLQVQADEMVPLRVELEVTPNLMEHVQVTATKIPLGIGEVAAQTDIVDRATIDRRGDQELTQAIAHLPGVIVSTQAGSFGNYALDGPLSLCYDSFMESLSVSFPVVSDLFSTTLSISLIALLPKIFSMRSWSVSFNHFWIFFLEV